MEKPPLIDVFPDKRRQILNILRKDARTKKSEISRRMDIPASTVAASIKSIERDIGLRYVSLLDCRKLGHNLRAAIIVRVKSSHPIDFIASSKEVNSFYRLREDNLFFVEAVFKGMKEMADFTDCLIDLGAEVKKKYHIIEDLKREGFEI